jgi:hypothetical protein
MNKVYCVFREEIIQMCYEIEVLDKIFKTREDAERYVANNLKSQDLYDRHSLSIEEMEVE